MVSYCCSTVVDTCFTICICIEDADIEGAHISDADTLLLITMLCSVFFSLLVQFPTKIYARFFSLGTGTINLRL